MHKTRQSVFNATYQAIGNDSIIADAIVPFTCYIKSFTLYTVVIEMGAFLSKERLLKLKDHQLYIANDDRKKYDAYKVFRNKIETLAKKFVTIASGSGNVKEKVSTTYEIISDYMNEFFTDRHVDLELIIIKQYVSSLLDIMRHNPYKFSDFSITLKSVYSEAHHSVNVSIFSALFARENGFTDESVHQVVLAGLLHDCGKRYIDQKLLQKQTHLNEDEFEIIKTIPHLSAEIAQLSGVSDEIVLRAIQEHHEKLDGSGYPNGLMLQYVTKEAQIVAICDTFDALTTKRTYREKFSTFEALLLMKNEMGSELNKGYITKFIGMFKEKS